MSELAIKALELVGFKREHWHREYPKVYKNLNERIEEVARARYPAMPNSILMAGVVDSGKTSMMACICKSIFDEWESSQKMPGYMKPDLFAGLVGYCSHEDLVNSWENEFNPDSLYRDANLYRNCQILFLDDLGAAPENVSGRNISKLEEFIDWRWSNRKKTIVSTNLSPDEYYIKDFARMKAGHRPLYAQWHRIFRRLLSNRWMMTVILTHNFGLDSILKQKQKTDKKEKR